MEVVFKSLFVGFESYVVLFEWDDVDVVYILFLIGMWKEWVIWVVEVGKYVLVEKLVVVDVKDLE